MIWLGIVKTMAGILRLSGVGQLKITSILLHIWSLSWIWRSAGWSLCSVHMLCYALWWAVSRGVTAIRWTVVTAIRLVSWVLRTATL